MLFRSLDVHHQERLQLLGMPQPAAHKNTLDSIKALSEIDFRNNLEEVRIADAGLPRSANRFAPDGYAHFAIWSGAVVRPKLPATSQTGPGVSRPCQL